MIRYTACQLKYISYEAYKDFYYIKCYIKSVFENIRPHVSLYPCLTLDK